jgi:hypothetical protein
MLDQPTNAIKKTNLELLLRLAGKNDICVFIYLTSVMCLCVSERERDREGLCVHTYI